MDWSTQTGRLTGFIKELEQRKISYQLNRNNSYSVTVTVFVPGEIWEVDFFDDEDVRVEVFKSNGEVFTRPESIGLINQMLEQNTDMLHDA